MGGKPTKTKNIEEGSEAVNAVKWSDGNGEYDMSVDSSASPLAATKWDGVNEKKSRAHSEGGDYQKNFRCR